MEVNTTPNPERGQALLTIGGEKYLVKFGMNVMRDVTRATGKGLTEIGTLLSQDFNEAATLLVAAAVRRAVPADKLPEGFTQDDAGDLIDALSAQETDELAEAITLATTTVNPLLAALSKQVTAKNNALLEATPAESGTTSLS